MRAVFEPLLPHGVTVAPQILNLLVKVRILMRQPFVWFVSALNVKQFVLQ